MAIQVINIGTSANKGDGEPLRTAFDKINDNFAELSLKVTNLETGGVTVTTGDIKGSVFGDDSTLLVDGINSTIPSANLSGALPAIDGSALTGITATTFGGQNASYYLDYNNFTNTPTLFSGAYADLTGKPTLFSGAFADLTSKPTTLSGYGISDAYTKTEVDNAISSSVLTSGSTHSIDIVAADSTLLVDSVNGTLNATTLTGALPAIDGSALTGITATTLGGQNASYYLDYNNFTNTPTIPSAYTDGNVDAHLNQSTAGANQVLSWTGSDYAWVAQSGGGGGTGDTQGSVFGDDSTLLIDGVNSTINSSALTKPIALADNEKITFGDDDDIQIYHHNNGTSIIQNATGQLQLRSNTVRLLNAATTKDFAYFNNNGSVDLYYDGTKKFETTTDGISVTDHIALPDGGEVRLGTDNDMQISHSGTSGLIKSTTGSLVLQGSTVRIQDAGSSQTAFSASNGVATLLFENATKLETNTNGVTITGDTTVSGNLTAGTGTVGGLTFAGTQIASDDSTQISFQDNIEIAGGPVISGFNLSHTGTFTINPYGLNLNTTGGNIAINPNNNLTLDVTGSSKTISIGNASTSGSAVSIGAEVNNTSVRMNGVTEFNARAIFSRGTHEIFYTFNGQGGVTDHNVMLGHLFYHTGVTGDLTPNFTNFDLTAEDATNITIIINQGNTAYEIPAIQIGGAAQTIVWQNNSAPTGTANGTDSFSFTILNDGGTYVVLGQMVSFGGV